MSLSAITNFMEWGENAWTPGEKFLVGGAFGVGIAAAYLLASDFTLTGAYFKARGEPIAELVTISNNVKRRPSDVPLWSSAKANLQLYQRDQIFTDAKSSAKVAFKDAGAIEIEENALVIIEQEELQPNLDVSQGSIVVKMDENAAKTINISAGGIKTSISGRGASAIVGKDENGRPKISMLKGEATINFGGRLINLSSNQEVTLDPKSNQPITRNVPPFELSAANSGNAILAPGDPLQLSWRYLGTSDAARYRVQISRGAGFTDVVFDRALEKNAVAIKGLSEGSYYWRVGIPNANAANGWDYSLPSKQAIQYVTPPTLKFPEQNQKIRGLKSGVRVSLDWAIAEAAQSYEIQMALDPSFKEIILSESRNQGPLESHVLPYGKYFWRARANLSADSGPTTTPWSEARVFFVVDPALLDAAKPKPVPLPPLTPPVLTANGYDFFRSMSDVTVAFAWIPTIGAVDYRFELAADTEFTKLISFAESPLPGLSKILGSGEFYARVAGRRADKELGQWSNIVRIRIVQKVELMRPVHASPAEGANFKYRDVEPDIKFGWESVPGSKFYDFEVSRDKDFKKEVIRKRVVGSDASVSMGAGSYYWRVASVDPATKQRVYSERSKFDVIQERISVEAIFPKADSIVDFDRDEPRQLQFVWRAPPDVMNRFLILSRNKDFTELVARVPVTGNMTKLEIYKNGEYYWIVEGRSSKDHAVARSQASHFTVQTTEVNVARTLSNSMRVEFGMNPHTETLKNTDSVGAQQGYKTTYTQSYIIALRGWIGSMFGIDSEFNSKQAKVTTTSTETQEKTSSSNSLLDAFGVLRMRFNLLERKFPSEIALRGGYGYGQAYSFYSDLLSETTIKKRTRAHYLITGIETSVPIGGTVNLEVKFDYLHLITSSPMVLQQNQSYITNWNLLIPFMSRGVLGLGFFYRSKKYNFTAPQEVIETSGSTQFTNMGLMYTMGWML